MTRSTRYRLFPAWAPASAGDASVAWGGGSPMTLIGFIATNGTIREVHGNRGDRLLDRIVAAADAQRVAA